MSNFLRIFLLLTLSAGFSGLFVPAELSLANDHPEAPREKQTRAKPAVKKKKTKQDEKKENDFENNVSETKHSHKSFDEELDEEPDIDALILLDASGSMLRTDPQRLRDQAAKLFVRFLNDKDRVSIFQFDQEVKRLSEFSSVTIESVKSIDEAIQTASTDGRFTDLEQPLEVALSTLRAEARPKAKRIVILLSDGQMDPPADKGDATALTEKLLSEIMPQYRVDKTTVYTVAMSPEADKELLGKIATEGRGLRFEATDIQTLHKRFSDLYLSLKRPQVVEAEGGGFEIDGSVDEATFYISREEHPKLTEEAPSAHTEVASTDITSEASHDVHSAETKPEAKHKEPPKEIALYSPANDRITMTEFPPGVRWYHGELFDVVTIRKPAPGSWRLDGVENPEGFATLVTDLKLQAKFDKTSMKIGESQTISVRLTSEGKTFNEKGLKEVTAYRFKVVSTSSGSTVQQGALQDKGEDGDEKADDGIFSAIVKASEEGDFKVLAGVTSPTFTRQQQIPFEVSPGSISLHLVKGDEFEKTTDAFLVKLTAKGKKLKSPEVEILAKKEDGKIVGFKLKAAAEGYRFDTAKLAVGKYTITGRITAKNAKSGDVERSNSEAIEYEKIEVAGSHDEHHEEGVEMSEAESEAQDSSEGASSPNYLGDLICIILALVWAGGLSFYMTKKLDIAKNLPAREKPYELSESLASEIKKIEEMASQKSRPPGPEEYEIFELVKSALPQVTADTIAEAKQEVSS
jgi:uncharacterized protein (TIGR03503 family)